MPAGREKFHALVSCHCSAAWSPDKPRAGRAVSVLESLALSLCTCSFCTHPHLSSYFDFFSLLALPFATFHLLSVFSFVESALALNTPASVCFSLVITEESRRQDKSFVTMATALRHCFFFFFFPHRVITNFIMRHAWGRVRVACVGACARCNIQDLIQLSIIKQKVSSEIRNINTCR